MKLEEFKNDFISVFRNETKRHMDEKGIFRKDITLDPKTPITELELSTRLKNVLLKHNVKFVSQLENITTKEVLHMKGLGSKLIVELQDFQYQYRITEFNKF
jgi:DNA-directed RNA polymerase alpha subunit